MALSEEERKERHRTRNREYARRQRAEHPEKMLEAKRKHRENPETRRKEREYQQQYLQTDAGKMCAWRSAIKRKFGVTEAEYNQMFVDQQGVCSICGRPEERLNRAGTGVSKLAIDHNHTTGQIRSLLCHRCNAAIGLLREDIGLLAKAIEYLDRWSE